MATTHPNDTSIASTAVGTLATARQATYLTRLALAMTAAWDFYTDTDRGARARGYLRSRGIDPRQLPNHYAVGYAPPGWTSLTDHLHRLEFTDHEILSAGLARRSSRGHLIDTLHDRVLFAIRDHDGLPIAFAGRDTSGHAHAPKYLTTPNTALHIKGDHLYGRWEALHSPGATQPVLLEGPLDVLALAARAPLHERLIPLCANGTALTRAQAHLVADLADQHSSSVVLAYDGDAPGRTAALHTGSLLHDLHLDVRVAHLPTGVDPADHLTRGGSPTIFAATAALPLIVAQTEAAIAAQGERMQWIEGRLDAARSIAPHLATYPPDQLPAIGTAAAAALGVEAGTLARLVTDLMRAPERQQAHLLRTEISRA